MTKFIEHEGDKNVTNLTTPVSSSYSSEETWKFGNNINPGSRKCNDGRKKGKRREEENKEKKKHVPGWARTTNLSVNSRTR